MPNSPYGWIKMCSYKSFVHKWLQLRDICIAPGFCRTVTSICLLFSSTKINNDTKTKSDERQYLTFFTSASCPPRFAQTLPSHVMTKCTIRTVAFPLTILTKVACTARFQTWASLVAWKTDALPQGLITGTIAMVTSGAWLTTAGAGLVT